MRTCAAWLTAAALLTLLAGCSTTPSYDPYESSAGVSDDQLAADITHRLDYDSIAGQHAYGVSVQDGVVTLNGSVPDEMVRARALAIARGTPGVKDVVDHLQRW